MRLFITYLILVGACIESLIPECSTISGRPAYSSKILVDKSFENVTINKDDSAQLRLEYYIHISNEYVGDEACDGESYDSKPRFSASVMDENLVSVEIYQDPNGDPRYEDESEVKLRIIGLERGTTSIWLEAGFLDDDYGSPFLVSESYEIKVEIQ